MIFVFLRLLYHCYVGKVSNNQRRNKFHVGEVTTVLVMISFGSSIGAYG